MFLIAKVGAHAGELREYSPEAAKALLESGRAENPYAAKPAPPKRVPDAPRRDRRKSRNGRN